MGSAISATVAIKSHSLPLKEIQANAYAAIAAIATGITVAGIAMAEELIRACHIPPDCLDERTVV